MRKLEEKLTHKLELNLIIFISQTLGGSFRQVDNEEISFILISKRRLMITLKWM